ncbi:MAG TPA: hypothetical protein VGN86_11700 [Pyrinomonadaceae bacterium]|nr:hypothetical protein [Pyrinomonadaceae bacterium]
MKKVLAFIAVSGLAVFSAGVIKAQSKTTSIESQSRPREVTPAPAARVAESDQSTAGSTERVALSARQFTPNVIRTRISEAERLFKTRPRQTALSTISTDVVTLALLDRATGQMHQLSLSKLTFLTKNSEVMMTTSLGTPVTLRIIRANGVNTAVTAITDAGHILTPLLVEFPIEKGGTFKEMAYYSSAHPALLSTELTRSGQTYVRSMIDLAAKRLREKGNIIAPHIVDVAERLCLVEHVDHERFRNENRKALFDEIYSLYALNELNTYRYSVSWAGAGGMVQMIPWAYNLERQRHPGVGLVPDFVVGMRNHGNALQVMLLYMQDTWNDMTANEDIQMALESKVATPAELLAAGYNSNAAKLPSYIRRGGNGWRSLIPRETQMYLQIYKSVDSLIPIKPRTVTAPAPKAE